MTLSYSELMTYLNMWGPVSGYFQEEPRHSNDKIGKALRSFCEKNAIRFDKVQVGHEKTPDCMLRVGDSSLVVEIKQFDSGPAERRTLQKSAEELDESDAFYDGIPGSRVRSTSDSAMPQLKRLSIGLLPTLLVLYDNVQLWPEICDPYAITVAMHGIETALLSPAAAPEGGATILAKWHGGSRRITSKAEHEPFWNCITFWGRQRSHHSSLSQLLRAQSDFSWPAEGTSIIHYRFSRSPEEIFAGMSPIRVR
jgi:hypothetical protein